MRRPSEMLGGGVSPRMDRFQDRHPMHPLLALWLMGFVGAFLALFLVEALAYAYERIGISEGALFGVIAGSFAGAAINIPIAHLHARPRSRELTMFGQRFDVPLAPEQEGTTLAVNVGGAVIPTVLSILLIVKDGIWWQALAATALVTVVVHALAKPEPGVGITVPPLVPPLLAAAIALAVAPHRAAAVAYAAGSLGTLIGADLLNLNRVGELGGGEASIGGAGTFDGVFLTGIVAVLLVAAS